jgi:uncharacterized membrane protein YbjE (DUF340 family)
MEIYKRIFCSVIFNGFLTTLLWVTAVYIYLFNRTTNDNLLGTQIAIYFTGMMGMFAGCIIGFIIGWLNKSALKSIAVGGLICFVVSLYFAIIDTRNSSPFIDEVMRKQMLMILPAVLAVLSAGLTAKLFNNPIKIK